MNTSSNDIRTNSERNSDPVPEYIYDIHQSLVEQSIITHQEIIDCSKYWINKMERDLPNPNKPIGIFVHTDM
jgi:hypothetical protein